MNFLQGKTVLLAGFIVATAVSAPIAHAALSAPSTLTQVIDDGTASTDIRDGSGNVISSPTIGMNSTILSTSQQTTTGTFGAATQRVTVDNPGGANNGWSLALNATTPGTARWTSSGNNYQYNGTAATGQLTVNPSSGTITPVVGGATGVSLGTSSAFTSTNAITLVTASAASADIWNGYVTGIGLSQTIPANQPAGTYTLSMTQTLTVL